MELAKGGNRGTPFAFISGNTQMWKMISCEGGMIFLKFKANRYIAAL